MIFTAAANDDVESIVDSAFENVEQGGYSRILSFKQFFPFLMIFISFRLQLFSSTLTKLFATALWTVSIALLVLRIISVHQGLV